MKKARGRTKSIAFPVFSPSIISITANGVSVHVSLVVCSLKEFNWMCRGSGLFNHRHDKIMMTKTSVRNDLVLCLTHNDAHTSTLEHLHTATIYFSMTNQKWRLCLYLTQSFITIIYQTNTSVTHTHLQVRQEHVHSSIFPPLGIVRIVRLLANGFVIRLKQNYRMVFCKI